jgi:hypothetical protein
MNFSSSREESALGDDLCLDDDEEFRNIFSPKALSQMSSDEEK